MHETEFFSYIENALTPYHAASESYTLLAKAGFLPWNGHSALWCASRQ